MLRDGWITEFRQRKASYARLHKNSAKQTSSSNRIYQSLIDDRLAFDALVAKFRDHSPLSEIDQVELRKCIYEMLVEGTLVTYQDRTYASYTMDEEGEDGEDEGE